MAKAKAEVELLTVAAAKAARLKPIKGPVSVRLVWWAPDARRRDVDSMAPMLKAVLDALVKKGIIPDDRSEIVREAALGPVCIARDNPRFELHILRLEE